MSRSKIVLTVIVFVMTCCLVFPVAPVAADSAPEGPSSPYVIYPDEEDIFTKTPEYRFTEWPGAVKYRIDIWKGTDYTQTPIFTQKFIPTCSAGECKFKPAFTLQKYDISGEKGEYLWRIRAKVGIEWPPAWSQKPFRVLSTGFNSQFTVTDAKWIPLSGDWAVNRLGYLKGTGNGDNFYSIVEKHLFTSGYKYEVMMKRKLCTDSQNTLFFTAYPHPMLWNRWDSGYQFEYYNNGRWRITQRVGNVQSILVPETESPAIVPYGWNKVTIWSDPPYFHFWINEVHLGGYQLTTFNEGYVGIGMYMNAPYEPLIVDWATLEYTDTAPYPIP